eukprot:3963872-Pleurochrysis_carterae.AAC.1
MYISGQLRRDCPGMCVGLLLEVRPDLPNQIVRLRSHRVVGPAHFEDVVVAEAVADALAHAHVRVVRVHARVRHPGGGRLAHARLVDRAQPGEVGVERWVRDVEGAVEKPRARG